MGFAILPPATTYDRVWRAEKKIKLVTWWNQTNRLSTCIDEEYRCFMEKEMIKLYSNQWTLQFISPDNMIIENFSNG